MAVLASFSSKPSSHKDAALRALRQLPEAIKKLPKDADASAVLSAVEEVLSKAMGAELAPVQKKAKKAAKASE